MYEKFRLANGPNIRLLEIKPDTFDSPLRCRLHRFSLEANPSYECVSYVWKALPGRASILCEGEVVEIGANLYTALKALRRERKARMIWVDALCINQEDGAEKSEQVSLMSRIYGHAKQVLLWLGPPSIMTENAFDKLKLLAMLWAQRAAHGAKEEMNIENHKRWVIRDRSQLDDKAVFDVVKTPLWLAGSSYVQQGIFECCCLLSNNGQGGSRAFEFDNTAIWQAVDDLFANPFFSRAWIVQEVALARNARIQCGSFSLHWEIFRNAFNGRQLLELQSSKSIGRATIPDAVSTVRDARKRFRDSNFNTDLASAMVFFMFSKATDHRDYIYAALGMIKTDHDILPDYEKDVEQVYLEAASRMIMQRQDLYLWGRNDPPRRKRYKELPTWVPDWSVESDENAMLHMNLKFLECLPKRITVNEGRLRVNAHLLDTVCFVAAVDVKDALLAPINNLIQLFEQLGLDLFEVYRADSLDRPISLEGRKNSNKPQSAHLLRLGHTFSILTKLKGVPSLALKTLSRLFDSTEQPEDHKMLNIEALWNTLCGSRYEPSKSRRPGFSLFLAWWYYASFPPGHKGELLDTAKLPKAYNVWAVVARLCSLDQSCQRSFAVMIDEHLSYVDEDEDLFVTKSGYIGRCPTGVAQLGHHVTILGGAYRPYLLAKQATGIFRFVSHAYVEGIMALDSGLAPHEEVSLIEIE